MQGNVELYSFEFKSESLRASLGDRCGEICREEKGLKQSGQEGRYGGCLRAEGRVKFNLQVA